jgi:hypothetical protein
MAAKAKKGKGLSKGKKLTGAKTLVAAATLRGGFITQ